MGFLGALGILVLVIIYLIKPNYQNKRISSTYVWRLSLKYKKRALPVSKIQNIITFICQMLMLTILTGLLASPVVAADAIGDEDEVVIIIDASAGMRISDEGETRFERAVSAARERAESAFAERSPVSIIIADESPELLFARVSADDGTSLFGELERLKELGADACSFGSADMTAAAVLAESITSVNREAQVYLYTGTDYTYHNGINVVSVATDNEWNATVIDCKAEMNKDNHYEITVNAACRGKTDYLTVYCAIHGANSDPTSTVLLEKGEFFDPSGEEKTLVFKTDDISGGAIYSYDYIEVYVSVRDSLADDNAFFLYGGQRPVIKVQYASSSPNNFFESAVRSLRQNKRERWDIQFTSLTADEMPATEGFDIYIFEHRMPDTLPTDGIVLLVDPDRAPLGSGLEIGSSYKVSSDSILASGSSHKLTEYVKPSRITVAKYNDIILSEGYEELAFYNGRPVMLLRDTPESKVVVWGFDLNYSNIIALPDFSILVYNMFNYFIPSTLESSYFEVGDTVMLNGRGTDLTVTGNGEEQRFPSGSAELVPTLPGIYEVRQNGIDGTPLMPESFFVKIPSSECNPNRTAEALPLIARPDETDTAYRDILMYLAIALVSLMFIEWVLEIKKNY